MGGGRANWNPCIVVFHERHYLRATCKMFFLQQDSSQEEMEHSLRKDDRGTVVHDLEVQSELSAALCTPVQKSVFKAHDNFSSALQQRSKVISEVKTVSNSIGSEHVTQNGDSV